MLPFKLTRHDGFDGGVHELSLPHACWWWGSLFGDALQRFKEAADSFDMDSDFETINTGTAAASIALSSIYFLLGVGVGGDKIAAFMASAPPASMHAPTAEEHAEAESRRISVGTLLRYNWAERGATPDEKSEAKERGIAVHSLLVQKNAEKRATDGEKREAKGRQIAVQSLLVQKNAEKRATADEKRVAKGRGIAVNSLLNEKTAEKRATADDIRVAKKRKISVPAAMHYNRGQHHIKIGSYTCLGRCQKRFPTQQALTRHNNRKSPCKFIE